MLAFPCFFGEIDVVSSAGSLLAAYVAARDDRRRWPNVFSPSWSPDGSRLAFIETMSDSATDYSLVGMAVKVINAGGTNVTTVATVQASSSSVFADGTAQTTARMPLRGAGRNRTGNAL
jgi:Tol biopolymer transport system component